MQNNIKNRETHFLGVITARRPTKRSRLCSRHHYAILIKNRKTHFLGVITARRLTKRSQVCSRYFNESTAPTSTKPLGSKRDLPPTGSDFSGTEHSRPPGAVYSSGERDPLEARPVGLSRAQGEARRPTKSSARRPHRSAGGTNPRRGASAHQERGARHVGPTAVSNVRERVTNSGEARRPTRSAGAGASARPAVNSNPKRTA